MQDHENVFGDAICGTDRTEDKKRQKRSVHWEHAAAQSGVPQYLGSGDDLKWLLMKAINRKTPGYRVSESSRLSFQGRWYVCPGLLSRLAGREFEVYFDRRNISVLYLFAEVLLLRRDTFRIIDGAGPSVDDQDASSERSAQTDLIDEEKASQTSSPKPEQVTEHKGILHFKLHKRRKTRSTSTEPRWVRREMIWAVVGK